MTKEEIKNKFFPLMSEDITMELTVGQVVDMIYAASSLLASSMIKPNAGRTLLSGNIQDSTLPYKLKCKLIEYEIDTIDKLLSFNSRRLLQCRGIGMKAVSDIKDFFDKNGLTWK